MSHPFPSPWHPCMELSRRARSLIFPSIWSIWRQIFILAPPQRERGNERVGTMRKWCPQITSYSVKWTMFISQDGVQHGVKKWLPGLYYQHSSHYGIYSTPTNSTPRSWMSYLCIPRGTAVPDAAIDRGGGGRGRRREDVRSLLRLRLPHCPFPSLPSAELEMPAIFPLHSVSSFSCQIVTLPQAVCSAYHQAVLVFDATNQYT